MKNKTVSKNLNFEEIYFEEHSYPSLINQITNLRHLSTVRQNRYFRKRYLSYFIGRTKNVIQNKEQGQNKVILKKFLVPVLLCLKLTCIMIRQNCNFFIKVIFPMFYRGAQESEVYQEFKVTLDPQASRVRLVPQGSPDLTGKLDHRVPLASQESEDQLDLL